MGHCISVSPTKRYNAPNVAEVLYRQMISNKKAIRRKERLLLFKVSRIFCRSVKLLMTNATARNMTMKKMILRIIALLKGFGGSSFHTLFATISSKEITCLLLPV
jgi:hypothetical protein